MNKSVRLLLATALLLLTILTIAGCTSYEAEGKRYQLEKMLYEANKRMETFSVKPELRTTSDFAYLVDGYRKVYRAFLDYFPDVADKDSLTESEFEAAYVAGRALSTAASTFITGQELDSAATILQTILDAPYFSGEHQYQALLLSGNIAKRRGRWLEAEEYYMELLQSFFPPVLRGGYPALEVLELPKTIVSQYTAMGDRETALARVNWAIGYYQEIVADTVLAGTPLVLSATRSLAEMYNAKGEYQKSVDLLSSVIDSTGQTAIGARMLVADLYFTRLNKQKEAVQIYEDVLQNDPDSMFIPSALMKLTRIAIAVKEYDRARNYIQTLKKSFRNQRQIQVTAQEMLANSYEEEGEWNRALQEYQFLITQYPETPQALEIMAFIPEYCRSINQPDLEKIWAEKSEEGLAGIVKEYSGRQMGLMASGQLARFYVAQERFVDAIRQLRQIRTEYPKSAHAADALLKTANIFRNNLNDKKQALEAYKEFVKQYPNSVVRPKVEEEIKKLEQG